MILNAFTFTPTGTEELSWSKGETREIGTIEATLGGKTKIVEAVRYESGQIVSWDFTGRNSTGKKAWPASVSILNDREVIWYGRDERVGRCLKSGLSFK